MGLGVHNGSIKRAARNGAIGDKFAHISASLMQLGKVRGAGAVAAREEDVLLVHFGRELGDQVRAGPPADPGNMEAGLFRGAGGDFAYRRNLQ